MAIFAVIRLLRFLCLSASVYAVSALNSDGTALLSLLRHWTLTPPSIKSTWNASHSTPCSSWVGVQCHPSHQFFVVSLNLSGYGISGQLGPEISRLYHLTVLDLSFNAFSGSIPSQLGNSTRLQHLDLSSNNFTGRLPLALGNLYRLSYLSLYDNSLTGTLPRSLFSIPALHTVYLSTNRLTGTIPSNVGNASELVSLWLYGNHLSGTIPPSIANCTSLQELYLGDNQLVGSLPDALDSLEHLVYFDVSSNMLEGNVPFVSGNCKEMDTFVFSFNNFTGSIPPALGNCSSLTQFAAVSCALTGPIPPSFAQLGNLMNLYLSDNRLSGEIPPELGRCASLVDLRIEENQLVGQIPVELEKLSQLQSLFLFTNHLTGEIPLGIWKIQSLQNLLVYQNNLSGEIPIEITELKQLRNLSLFENQFTGVVPQGLGINSTLVQIDLTSNRFTGPIPPDLCFGNQLRKLNLGQNDFRGSIPPGVGSCSNLTRLILKQNHLTGIIPDFVENPNLVYINLSSNNLSGEIPISLANLTKVTSIDLSMNKLSGPIHPELGRLVELQAIDLSHNSLEGELPFQLSTCEKLSELEVSNNLLNGSIPASFRSLTELSTLGLSENRFAGDIPVFLFEFERLSTLHLGGNSFGGSIPASVGSPQAGENMRSLNLSSNRLMGQVPPELGRLDMLEDLDISSNNLSGSLGVLDNMHSLVFINVSHNHFAGPVPATLLKLLNSSPSSFEGNLGLCVNCLSGGSSSCTEKSFSRPCTIQSENKRGRSKVGTVMIALGSSLLCISLLGGLAYMFLRRKGPKLQNAIAAEGGASSLLNEIMEATENLSGKYVIGRGAHGTVYKASLGSGRVYAVKKVASAGSRGGSKSMIREIQTIGAVRHRNLVKLEEFWFRKDYGLILYNYMKNGSLHDVLHERNPPLQLEWSIRYKIALGTAQGLSYLHFDCDPAIVHRDIKPMNILLDSEWEPHISDFGLAKLLDEQQAASMSCSAVIGTVGYIAPENAFTTTKSKESDVYSYGVVLLELITRKKPLLDPSRSFNDGEGEEDLVSWVRSVWNEAEEIKDAVDPGLLDEFIDSSVMEQATNVLLVALRCTAKEPSKRPSMRDVVKQLTDAYPISTSSSRTKSNLLCSYRN
nr:receptor-like protein kinase [Coffea arabica]